jgi:hypothetical protein
LSSGGELNGVGEGRGDCALLAFGANGLNAWRLLLAAAFMAEVTTA